MGDNPEIRKAAAMSDHFPRSYRIQSRDVQTSEEFLDTKSTAVDSLLLLVLRPVLQKCVEILIPRMARSSGLISAKSQMSMSMEIQSVLDLPIRLENMLSWEM